MISILKGNFEKIDGIIILSEKYSQQNISVLARSVLDGFLDLNFMLKTSELGMMDFCYAPPFAKTWDVLNISGNVAK